MIFSSTYHVPQERHSAEIAHSFYLRRLTTDQKRDALAVSSKCSASVVFSFTCILYHESVRLHLSTSSRRKTQLPTLFHLIISAPRTVSRNIVYRAADGWSATYLLTMHT